MGAHPVATWRVPGRTQTLPINTVSSGAARQLAAFQTGFRRGAVGLGGLVATGALTGLSAGLLGKKNNTKKR